MSNTEHNDGDEHFTARAKAVLERSELDIDPDRLARLQQARRMAVAAAAAEDAPRTGWLSWALPAGAVATVALVAGLLITPDPQTDPLLLDPAEMSAAAEMELLDELEFVAWMLEQDHAG